MKSYKIYIFSKGKIEVNSDFENGIRPRTNSGRIALAKRLSTLSASSFGNIAVASAEVQHQRMEILPKRLEEKNEDFESQELLGKSLPTDYNNKVEKTNKAYNIL